MTKLRERLSRGIREKIERVSFTGHPRQRLPGSVSVCVEQAEGEAMVLKLDQNGIAVSSGSACTAGAPEPSQVLLATGLPPAVAQGSLRFTIGRENTEADIDYVLEILPDIVRRLRAMSPSD